MGIAALAAVSGRTETKRLHAWLFGAFGAAVLFKIYEVRVFDWVGRLPVLEQIIFPRFAPPLVSFAFAVLAGIGVQVVQSGDLRPRRFIVLLATATVLLIVFVRTGDRWSTILGATPGYFAFVWTRGFVFASLAVAAVLLGASFQRRWPALLLASVVVAELLLLNPSSSYAKRADPFLVPGWMPFVQTALGPEQYSRVFALDGKLYPNTAGALGLQDIRALDALYVERYMRYVRTFLAPNAYDRFTGEEAVMFRENPMFDALAVRAVLSQRNLGTSPSLRFIGTDGLARVYENTKAYPRAWVVHRVHVVQGEDEAFTFLEAGSHRKNGAVVVAGFDPRREAVVEHRGDVAEKTFRSLQDGRTACVSPDRDRATIESYAGTTVTLHVQAACPGLLVIPDTYFPGWKAFVNGRGSVIYPTDGAFRGVLVPRGHSRIEFRYEPRGFRIGIVVALAGIAGFAGLVVASHRRYRRE